MKHYVTVEIEIESKDHPMVQSIVLDAVVRAFGDRRSGPCSVSGFDREKLEKTLASITEERNTYHSAWSKEKNKP